MKIELWAVDKPRPYERNARKISDLAIEKVARSIQDFGWQQPIVVDRDGVIIAGHTRLLAAKKLGQKKVPVYPALDLTPEQVKAYRLADNRSHEEAEWDLDMLGAELFDLKVLGFDLVSTAFDEDELAQLFSKGKVDDEDVIPPAPANPVTVTGDVFRLGTHRLMCGDSTSPEDVGYLMEDKRASLCFTSPPYGQQRNYESGIASWLDLMLGVFGNLPVIDTAQVLVNLGLIHKNGEWEPYWDEWITQMRAKGWRRFAWYVWDQGPGLPGDWNGRLAPAHEFIFHFNRVAEKARKTKACKHAGEIKLGKGLRGKNGVVSDYTSHGKPYQDTKIPDSVVRVMRHKGGLEKGVGVHPAVFPVELPYEMISAFSDVGDVLYEPFAGSGTQVIAAEKLGRNCYAMELEPAYCDVILARWRAATGKPAVLAATGQTFDHLREERLGVVA